MARKIIDALAEDIVLTVLDTADIGSRKLKEIVSEHKDEITTSLEHIQQEYMYLKLCLSFQTFTLLAHEKDLKISKQFFLSIINELNTKHQNVFNVYTAANREEEYGNVFEKEDIATVFIREAKLSDTSFEVKEVIKKRNVCRCFLFYS